MDVMLAACSAVVMVAMTVASMVAHSVGDLAACWVESEAGEKDVTSVALSVDSTAVLWVEHSAECSAVEKGAD